MLPQDDLEELFEVLKSGIERRRRRKRARPVRLRSPSEVGSEIKVMPLSLISWIAVWSTASSQMVTSRTGRSLRRIIDFLG